MVRILYAFGVTDYHKQYVCVCVCVVPSMNKTRMGTMATKAQALKASAKKRHISHLLTFFWSKTVTWLYLLSKVRKSILPHD